MAKSHEEVAVLKPNQAVEWLKGMIPTGEPLWIWGKPGIGKTDVVRQAARDVGYECPHFPPAITLESVDIRGFGFVDRQAEGGPLTQWAPPAFWPRGEERKMVIFLDELPQAGRDVQSAFLQLCHGGRLGDYVLPRGVSFVVCGNRMEDKAGVNRVITPLLNRFCHVQMETDLDAWFQWALPAGVHPAVIAFLRFRGEKLFDTFDPKAQQVAFATPRTWEKVGNVLRKATLPDYLLQPTVTGLVGSGPAAEFCTYYAVMARLPDPDAVLADPAKGKIPGEPAVLYALCAALADRMRGCTDPARIRNFVTYCERMGAEQAEYSVLAMKDGIAVNQRVLPAAKNWIQQHKDVFASMMAKAS